MIKLNEKSSKTICIVACSFAVAVIILIGVFKTTHTDINPDYSKEDVCVTAEDLEQYRQNIGSSMETKKSILIIFNTMEECQTFIKEYGSDKNVLTLGKGIIPQMQGENDEQYFNVVGNAVFESLFDTMKDGEYLKYPVEFGGAYCYFKRLQKYCVTEKDEDLKEFIRNEKSMKKGGEIE